MRVEPLSPTIGAAIYDVNIYDDKSPELKNKIQELLGKYEVLFFKNQRHLSPKEYLEVSELMGTPIKHPFISTSEPVMPGISPFQPHDGFSEITGIYNGKVNKGNLNEWHSDLNWLAQPSLGSVLRCVKASPIGGDTLWVSMSAAFEGLSENKKKVLSELFVVHDFSQIYRDSFPGDNSLFLRMQEIYPPQVHPLVLKQ